MTSNHAPASATPPPGKQATTTGLPGRGGTAPDTHGTGPAPRRRRRAAAALAMLAVPLAVTALTAIPAAAATGPYVRAAIIGLPGKDAYADLAVAVDSSTHTAYVLNYGTYPDGGYVSVINESTNTVTATIPISIGINPDAVAVDPSTDTVYVGGSGGVLVINGATNTVTATIDVGDTPNDPNAVAVDPSTDTVYVANWNGSSVSVINGATNTVTATIGGIGSAYAVAVDPSTHAVYVTQLYQHSVSVINGAACNRTVTTGCGQTPPTITVGIYPDAVAVDPSTDTVYVGNSFNGVLGNTDVVPNVSVINGATNTVTGGVAPTAGGFGRIDTVAVDPSTHAVYVAQAGYVSVINGATCNGTVTTGCGGGQTLPTIGTGSQVEDAVAVDPSLDIAYAADASENQVSVITYPSDIGWVGYDWLVADNSGLCVDVYGSRTSNLTAIDQYTCHTTGQANQQWQWIPVSGGYGELQNQNSGKDLVVLNASTAAGAKIIQYDQNGTFNGLWKPTRINESWWQFQNANSGQCLDVPGSSKSPGVQLDQQPCQSNPTATGNQMFRTP